MSITSSLQIHQGNPGVTTSGSVVKQEDEVIDICNVEPEECLIFEEDKMQRITC